MGEFLLLWFCGARNTGVKIELGEDELNIVFSSQNCIQSSIEC